MASTTLSMCWPAIGMNAAAVAHQQVPGRPVRSRSIISTVVAVVGQHAAAIAADSSNYTIVATPHGPQVAAGVVFGAHPKLVAANGRAAGGIDTPMGGRCPCG